MIQSKKLNNLRKKVKVLYENRQDLLFHGWHHINFVTNKALEFAKFESANLLLVEAAALTHDLNFIVKINSEIGAGKELRNKLLLDCGFETVEVENIELIISEAHTATRGKKISLEGMCLSDADTLFKALPITPILFSSNYIKENKVDIKKLADKIIVEQVGLIKKNIYFYTKPAKKYLGWAKVNLELWENVREALEDEDVKELLKLSKMMKII